MNQDEFKYYICRSKIIPGSKYREVVRVARPLLNGLKAKSKRRPYIRSTYFSGEKIFLDNFWPHLMQKNPVERLHRLKLLQCAIELIQKTKYSPTYKVKVSSMQERYYRFYGKVKVDNCFFAVQIKEDLRRAQKFFMSAFKLKK